MLHIVWARISPVYYPSSANLLCMELATLWSWHNYHGLFFSAIMAFKSILNFLSSLFLMFMFLEKCYTGFLILVLVQGSWVSCYSFDPLSFWILIVDIYFHFWAVSYAISAAFIYSCCSWNVRDVERWPRKIPVLVWMKPLLCPGVPLILFRRWLSLSLVCVCARCVRSMKVDPYV